MYGIKNCDTVKKALKWLQEKEVEYQFHDFRKDGLEVESLQAWVNELGTEILLNKRGTTWRKLPDEKKDNLSDKAIIELLLENPAMIKRPVFDLGNYRRVGFSKKDQEDFTEILT